MASEILADLVDRLDGAQLSVNNFQSEDWDYVVLNRKFVDADVYARLYVDQDDDGGWCSVLYPQRHGNVHVFQPDPELTEQMGPYVRVPPAGVVAPVQRWMKVTDAWHTRWAATKG